MFLHHYIFPYYLLKFVENASNKSKIWFAYKGGEQGMHKVVHIYPEYHSLCPHVGIRTPPPTVSVSPL
jgi:hypothetical protein